MSPSMGVAKFDRLLRRAVPLDVDRSDLRRLHDFLGQQVYDRLLIGQSAARANQRDVLQPWDLPITGGLRQASPSSGPSTRSWSCRPFSSTWPPCPCSIWGTAPRPRRACQTSSAP